MLSASAASPKDDSPEGHLLESAFAGNLEGVKAALAQGADINSRDDKSGQTALMGSVLRGHVEVVRHFLDNGAGKSLNQQPNRRNPNLPSTHSLIPRPSLTLQTPLLPRRTALHRHTEQVFKGGPIS
jgi:ankyrin repeat protein